MLIGHYSAPQEARYTCPVRPPSTTAALIFLAAALPGAAAVEADSRPPAEPAVVAERAAATTPLDPCLAGLLSRSAAPLSAERACSDVIAGLGILLEPTPEDVQALASAYSNRAVARIRAGELAGAAADLGDALLRMPEGWAIYLNRGNLYLALGDHEAALADFQRVTELAPETTPALAANRLLAYRRAGDLPAAEAVLAESRASLKQKEADRSALPAGPRR